MQLLAAPGGEDELGRRVSPYLYHWAKNNGGRRRFREIYRKGCAAYYPVVFWLSQRETLRVLVLRGSGP